MVTVWGGKELGERRPVWLQKSESKDDGVDETEVLQVGFRIFFFFTATQSYLRVFEERSDVIDYQHGI